MLIPTGKVIKKPTLFSHQTFMSRAVLTTSLPKLAVLHQAASEEEHLHTALLLTRHRAAATGSARRAQPHTSPTAGNGNSLCTQLLLLGTFLSVLLTNPVTIAPEETEETAAHVHPASRAPAGNPTSGISQPCHPTQHNSFWNVPQEVSSLTSTSKQGHPTLLMASSSLEAHYIHFV